MCTAHLCHHARSKLHAAELCRNNMILLLLLLLLYIMLYCTLNLVEYGIFSNDVRRSCFSRHLSTRRFKFTQIPTVNIIIHERAPHLSNCSFGIVYFVKVLKNVISQYSNSSFGVLSCLETLDNVNILLTILRPLRSNI